MTNKHDWPDLVYSPFDQTYKCRACGMKTLVNPEMFMETKLPEYGCMPYVKEERYTTEATEDCGMVFVLDNGRAIADIYHDGQDDMETAALICKALNAMEPT